MFPSFTSIDFSSFRTLTESFFLSDFFDVAIIAIFIYSALILFKRTRSLTILAGISIIVVLYGISQLFHLTLTSVVLQSFFGAFFLVLIIIFQEEVRRFFDIITVWGTRQKHMGRGLAEINRAGIKAAFKKAAIGRCRGRWLVHCEIAGIDCQRAVHTVIG